MDIVEEIRSKISIVDLVSKYVTLKPSGSTMKACCPFHAEKTPSFHVFPDKGTWHCFGGCGLGGDIFTFIEKVEGIDFKEAVRILAEQANIPIPDSQQSKTQETLYEINSIATKFYAENMKGAPLDYMLKRGFSVDTLSRFQIGMSPADNDLLFKYLRQKGHSAENIIKSGLALRKDKPTDIRDFFFNRIMFPIKNEGGRIVGFAGRSLEDKSKVKYLNTPITPIFNKRDILWGIDKAKVSIRKEKCLVLVEGYTDVMMAHQHGFCNTVGLCGSSITPEHMITIKRYARHILLALDPDAAGEQATLRGIKIARSVFNGHADSPEWLDGDPAPRGDIKILELPNGMDPDVCIHLNPAEWQLRIYQAKPVIDYLFDAVFARVDLSREVGKASAAEQLMPIIKDIEDPIERELYIEKLSKCIGVSRSILNNTDYGRTITKKAARIKEELSLNSGNAEEYCLALILSYGNTSEMAGLIETLTPDHFAKLENREVFTIWRQEKVPEEIHMKRHYDFLVSYAKKIPIAGTGTLSDCIKWLETARLDRQKTMVLALLRDATTQEDREKYLQQLDELREARK